MDIKSRITATIWPWGTETPLQMECAAKDISEIGYTLFESTKDSIYAFDMNIDKYREVLKRYNVNPVSFYFQLPSPEEADRFFDSIDKELEFVANLDVRHISLQATWGRPDGRLMKKENLEIETELFVRFTQKCKEYGILSSLHSHEGSWAMYEDEIDYYMNNVGSDLIWFCPDTAHLVAGGCDPVEMVEKYKNRIIFTHFKDIKNAHIFSTDNVVDGAEAYRNFCELGKGDIDFGKIFDILKNVGYDGPLCEEIDKALVSNKESAKNNFNFLLENY